LLLACAPRSPSSGATTPTRPEVAASVTQPASPSASAMLAGENTCRRAARAPSAEGSR
jgi:hypothetical protein